MSGWYACPALIIFSRRGFGAGLRRCVLLRAPARLKRAGTACHRDLEGGIFIKTLFLGTDIKLYAHETERGKSYVVPPVAQPSRFRGDGFLWLIDESESRSTLLRTSGGYRVNRRRGQTRILFEQPYETRVFEGYPSCDFLGNPFQVLVDHADYFEKAMARFYWKSILNQCAERTFMRHKRRLREGYVLSTLQTDFYAGTYPAVDHEFHIRGRLAMGDDFDLQVVRRMIELQLRMMRTDWRRQFRAPCSVQPGGRREYRVRRKSRDQTVEAVMFPLTGVIEIVEEVYHYYCLTKEAAFVREHIATLEKGLAYVQRHIDGSGRLWGDVYYEDQVMKDGANAQAQAFAFRSFLLMARLETLLGNCEKARAYAQGADALKRNYVLPLPDGYWSEEHGRYVDWIDRHGGVHDHIHLLSNALSVTFGFNDPARDQTVHHVIETYDPVFQKFPSFVAAKIEDYTESEIGVGGPYDLCAAGRYWCHDAKYRRSKMDAALLKAQLTTVAGQAEADGFQMGERYDMSYIYYNTGADSGRNWHGAALYYEYPNVFLDVLVHDFLGLCADEEADLLIAPCCTAPTEVSMASFGIAYTFTGGQFTLKNCSDVPKKLRVDLSALYTDWESGGLANAPVHTLAPGQELVFAGSPRMR